MVGAVAIALTVVGAGAAVGIASTHGGGGHVRTGTAPSPGTTTPNAGATVPTLQRLAAGTGTGSATVSTAVAPVQIAGGGASSAAGASGGGASGAAGGRPAGSVTSAPEAQAGGHPGPAGGGQSLPPAGTYTYDTSGTQAFGNFASNSYPKTTTMVLSPTGCGQSSTWNSSKGNSSTVDYCPTAGGLLIRSESTKVTYSFYSETMTFNCDPDAFVPVTAGRPGQTWHWSCSSQNGVTTSQLVTLIGAQTVTVGSEQVATEHVRVKSTISGGGESGTAVADYWFTSDALTVKETGNIQARQGKVTYTSQYALVLESLSPGS